MADVVMAYVVMASALGASDEFSVLRLLLYLEDHASDDAGLVVVNGSHAVPAFADMLPWYSATGRWPPTQGNN